MSLPGTTKEQLCPDLTKQIYFVNHKNPTAIYCNVQRASVSLCHGRLGIFNEKHVKNK